MYNGIDELVHQLYNISGKTAWSVLWSLTPAIIVFFIILYNVIRCAIINGNIQTTKKIEQDKIAAERTRLRNIENARIEAEKKAAKEAKRAAKRAAKAKNAMSVMDGGGIDEGSETEL